MEKKNKYFIQDGMISRFDFMDNQEFYPLTTLCSMLNDNDEKYDKLAKKFVIVSKALELLAQDYISYTDEMEITPIIDYYIRDAEEKLKNG